MEVAVRPTVHRAFGLRILSRIPLPELPLSEEEADGEAADVVIETAEPGRLWPELEACGNNFSQSGRRFLFLIPETAVFCIEDGRTVTVAPLPGAYREKVRVYLLGTCLGALLLIRRVLPLHGSAVVIDGRAYAFLGDSGAGKSTLAAALVGMGHRLVSDDVVAVACSEDGKPVVLPSYPQQKLWRESLEGLGIAGGSYRPIYRETEKFAVPAGRAFRAEPLPLAGAFELGMSKRGKIAVRRLGKLERLRAMMSHTYRGWMIPRLGLTDWHFHTAASVAARIETCRLQRPPEGFTARQLAEAVIGIAREGVQGK